jgi:hypothetical protein
LTKLVEMVEWGYFLKLRMVKMVERINGDFRGSMMRRLFLVIDGPSGRPWGHAASELFHPINARVRDGVHRIIVSQMANTIRSEHYDGH